MVATSKIILPYEPGYVANKEADKRRKETEGRVRQREREFAERQQPPLIVQDVGRHRASLVVAVLFGEQESTEQVNCAVSSMHQACPLYAPIADVSRSAANRRFGPKPGIASFNSIDYDDRLIVASLF